MTEDAPAQLDAVDLNYEVDGARLLEAVGLNVGGGELVGLIGPNGAGKSTLLRVLAGIIRRTGGEVVLEGDPLDRLSATEVARRLALLGQHTPDTFGFTALEVVLTGRYPHLGRFAIERAEDRAIALNAMHQTDSEQFATRDAGSLSGGERQRVFLARSLAQQPRVFLLDEPTASLDVHHQLATFDLMRALAHEAGLAVIAAVHDLRLAARYCDRLVLLHHGCIVASGAPEDVLTPANLASVFGVRALVYREPFTGALTVDFHPGPIETSTPIRVHVLRGDVPLAPLLYALTAAGFEVTTDDLPPGTLDRFVADALGIECSYEAAARTTVLVDAGGSVPARAGIPTITYSPGDAPDAVIEAVRAAIEERATS